MGVEVPDEIQLNDEVRLKSGGPKMIVIEIVDDYATCDWFEKNEKRQDRFKLQSLVKVKGFRELGNSLG